MRTRMEETRVEAHSLGSLICATTAYGSPSNAPKQSGLANFQRSDSLRPLTQNFSKNGKGAFSEAHTMPLTATVHFLSPPVTFLAFLFSHFLNLFEKQTAIYHVDDEDSFDSFLQSKGVVVPDQLVQPVSVETFEKRHDAPLAVADDKGKEEARTTSPTSSPTSLGQARPVPPSADKSKASSPKSNSNLPQCPFCTANVEVDAQGCNCGAFVVEDDKKKKKKRKSAKRSVGEKKGKKAAKK